MMITDWEGTDVRFAGLLFAPERQRDLRATRRCPATRGHGPLLVVSRILFLVRTGSPATLDRFSPRKQLRQPQIVDYSMVAGCIRALGPWLFWMELRILLHQNKLRRR